MERQPINTPEQANEALAAAGLPKAKRKGNRHRPGYHADYMRQRRAKQKGKPT